MDSKGDEGTDGGAPSPDEDFRDSNVTVGPVRVPALLRRRARRPSRPSIAIVGNTNNAPLVLGEALSDLGAQVTLFAYRSTPLHSPTARWRNDPRLAIDETCLHEDDFRLLTPAYRAMRSAVARHDVAVLNDLGPSMGPSLSIPYTVYLTGSDLTYFASRRLPAFVSQAWSATFLFGAAGQHELASWRSLADRQRWGIRGATSVAFHPPGLDPVGDAMLREMGIDDSRRYVIRFADLASLSRKPLPARGDELRIASLARCDFRPSANPMFSTLDLKGTDVLLRGFARFREEGGRGVLTLPTKGKDLAAARDLAIEVGIESFLEWRPEVPFHEYLDLVASADVVIDSLGPSGPASVSYDAYGVGRPVIANLRQEVFQEVYSSPHPGLQADSPAALSRALHRLQADPSLAVALANDGRLFADTYLSPTTSAARVVSSLALDL